MNELFVKVFGYTLNPSPNFNLIAATDRDIDARVYALYGMTDEEIKTIEG